MEDLLLLYQDQFLIFLLVLTRISGLLVLAPVWSSQAIPVRIRAFMAIGLALLVTPMVWGGEDRLPTTLLDLAILAGMELALGLCVGLAVLICFAGLQLAGQVMGQMSGMSLADVVSPTFESSVPVFSHLLHITMLTVFLTIGGHRAVLQAMIDLFQQMPPGQIHWSPTWMDALTLITQSSFVLGLQVAAPTMMALMLSVLIMGLISRTLPQLNILAVGFSVNALVMLSAFLLSLGVLARVFERHCLDPIEILRPAFGLP